MIANTPKPPYYAVIFTTVIKVIDEEYEAYNQELIQCVKNQPGYLGMESLRDDIGITISYWRNKEDIMRWKHQPLHKDAKEKGKTKWYKHYKIRVCKVEYDNEL